MSVTERVGLHAGEPGGQVPEADPAPRAKPAGDSAKAEEHELAAIGDGQRADPVQGQAEEFGGIDADLGGKTAVENNDPVFWEGKSQDGQIKEAEFCVGRRANW